MSVVMGVWLNYSLEQKGGNHGTVRLLWDLSRHVMYFPVI